MKESSALPALVDAATGRATRAGFTLSCEPAVGGLLAVLATHVPPGARILELGTGAGVGTAWIVSGLAGRADVTVVTVEQDPGIAALAAEGDWPGFVDLRVGDVLDLLGEVGAFDLVFADAQAGKSRGLDRTVAALAPRGMLVVDDMTPQPEWTDRHCGLQDRVRRTLLSSPSLCAIELSHGSGVILAARRG